MKISTRRRLTTSAAVVTATTLLLTGCAKGGGTSSSSEDGTITLWTHNAGNAGELGAIQTIVDDFNASQSDYQVELQAFPQDSYNQSVTAAAAAKKLPCIMDIDGPNVPNWAWAGYLAPLEGMDEELSDYLPTTIGKYDDKIYSYGYYDVSLVMVSRQSILDENGIRTPTIDQPWTKDEFSDALAKLKASGKYEYPADFQTGSTGEWWPYAYSPFLQSFGGDLIDRDGYKSADGVLNGPEAVEWATWFRGLAANGDIALKSGSDPAQDFANGKTGILYSGSWTAVPLRKAFDDTVFLPTVDLGQGPKIGGGSWQWGMSATCENTEAASAYLKFAAQDEYVAKVATDTNNIPTTPGAAAEVPGFEDGGENDIFRQYAEEYAVLRPVTPGYPFIATTFTKAAQDILNGADPQATLDQATKDIDANQQQNNYFQ